MIAANEIDDPSAASFAEIAADPAYGHLTFVPASAYAEKVLKAADESGTADYRPGDDDFGLVGDLSGEQAPGLERIRGLLGAYGGTGVQASLEAAPFDALDLIAVFPGSDDGSTSETGVFGDAFLLPEVDDVGFRLSQPLGPGRRLAPRQRLPIVATDRRGSRTRRPRRGRTRDDELVRGGE